MPVGIYKHKKGYKRSPKSKEWIKNSSLAMKKRWATGNVNGFKKGNTINLGKKYSEERRKKISLALKGERNGMYNMTGSLNPAWKAEKVKHADKRIRKSKEYVLWRTAVFIRDDYTCQNCETKGGNLQADHIKPFALYPQLRFAIDNGRTLCVDCHMQTDTWGGRTTQLHRIKAVFES